MVEKMPRPVPKFHDYIGQKRIVDYLRRLIDGALTRNEPFPHTLMLGPSGVGKTRLSKALSTEFKTDVVEAMGYEDRAALSGKLVSLSTGDFLFIDECHRLHGPEQELLCEAIDRKSIPNTDRKRSDQGGAVIERTVLKPWTLILATDQPGLLLDALRKRIDVEVSLPFYTGREMKEIVESMASDLNLLLSPQAALLLADVAVGLPRRAKQLLRNLRMFHPGAETQQLGLPEVREFLEASGVDKAGLNTSERRYLEVIVDLGGASLETLALGLGTDIDFVRRQIEPNLVRRRLVKITSAGRQITPKGLDHIQSPKHASQAQDGDGA
jgi:Holliday junction DNA helicase RuvB